ncbi:AfsR/SARP family transcriptional regulator [Nocardia altamirensis]|uniref:AfsR/SARP family transcriptional regulator n=1 Tax=Nocardia altamirensis TaxID=472158 RepID=UPI0008404393|nr:tetratricopeptide repeat protein [Nocardia altamirensis]
MEFRLLGGVEAFHDGRPIDIGHARQQCVLAVLLIEVDTVVTVDQLVDRVWGVHVSPRARNTLHTYITRLRRCLAVADGEVKIVRRAGTYRLAVAPLAVDLHRFRHLITQAGGSDDRQAMALYEQALGLWRGEPFSSLDTPWINSVGAALAAERLSAELQHTDVQLRCGKHANLVAGLTTRAAERPLDERLSGQLMLALYRNGRQADALRHYQQIRRQLADELGADPGPALQRLHQQILTADPALTIPGAVAVSSALPVPRQLPAMPQLFAGRVRERAVLTEFITAHANAGGTVVISAIGGIGGIGKTWLALYWAHQNAHRYPDGQLFVNLRGFDPAGPPVDPAVAVRGFLEALGVAPAAVPQDFDSRTALYRSLIADKRMLVVLDNAIDSAQVAPLLPGNPATAVVITSRNAMPALIAGHSARSLSLSTLADDEARHLLIGHLGAERVAAEPSAVTELVDHCAGLPLALGIIAARAASHPALSLATLAAEIRDSATRLDAMDTGELSVSLRAVFSWSYHTLPPDAARAFGLLGLAPGSDISQEAVADLTALTTQQTRTLLRELETACLIQQSEPGRYRMHDLLRLYATEQADTDIPAEARHAALGRLIDFALHTAYAAAKRLDPNQPPMQLAKPADCHPYSMESEAAALAWLDTERANLLAVAAYAADNGWPTHTGQLSPVLWRYLDVRGHYDSALDLHTRALAADRVTGNRALASHTLVVLGLLHWRSGLYERALGFYEEGLASCRAVGIRMLEGYALYGSGLTCASLGRFTQARNHYQDALALAGELGVGELEADARHGLAMIYRRLGRYEEGLAELDRAVPLARGARVRDLQGRTIHGIGQIYERMGRFEEALTHLDEALAIGRGGSRPLECYALCTLGATYQGMGDHAKASTHLNEAFDIARETGSLHLQTNALTGLGHLALATADPDQARTHYETALTLAGRTGERDQLAHAHNGIATAAEQLADQASARHHWQQALEIYAELGVPEADEVRRRMHGLDCGTAAIIPT